DHVRLGCGKHEFAADDVDLAAAEIFGVQAALDRSNDLARILVAGEHVGVRHARHGDVRERFAPPVTGRGDTHEARIQRVLHVPGENAVLDQYVALRGVAFVVDVQRAAAAVQSAVIYDRDARCGDALTDATGKGRAALAVEVALETVPDGLVQQHARPARAEHDGHRAGGRCLRLEVDPRLLHRLLDVPL